MKIVGFLFMSFFLFQKSVSLFSKRNLSQKNRITALGLKKSKNKHDENNDYFKELYKPKTLSQIIYYNHLNDPNVSLIFIVGPAGTGKTLLACSNAIKQLKNGYVNKIIITRPVVSVDDEEIGFLPGNINKKMDPWMRPIFDIFSEYYSQTEIHHMMNNNVIEIAPLAYMRGRTFKNTYIIADEMQNSSPNQMMMLTTRIGQGSKMVITGDLKQSDKSLLSGLSDFIEKYKNYGKEKISEIKLVELGNVDIERSPIIVKLLDIYSYKKEIKEPELETEVKTGLETEVETEIETEVETKVELELEVEKEVEKEVKKEVKKGSDAAMITLKEEERIKKRK